MLSSTDRTTGLDDMAHPNNNHGAASSAPRVEMQFCVPDEQLQHLPKRPRAPHFLPLTAPVPRIGETVYLSSSSAWSVERIVHEYRNAQDLRIEIWLEYAGPGRRQRSPGFMTTQ